MEGIAIHSTWADAQVLSNNGLCSQLPAEIVNIIRASDGIPYLDALARATLIPEIADQLSTLYDPLVVEIAARWCRQISIEDPGGTIRVFAGFARVLPGKACLKIILQAFMEKCKSGFLGLLAESSHLALLALDVDSLCSFLLALFRLYSHDDTTYSSLVSPVQLSSLLRHGTSSVRYLAVRCLALYMKSADSVLENMVAAHVPENETSIQVDGAKIPARLFSLWEERRRRDIDQALVKAQYDRCHSPATATRSLTVDMLSSQTAALADVLLPRTEGIPAALSLVSLPTTTRNLEKLAKAVLDSNAILLTGASGSGKTVLINEAARVLNKLPSMVTLHLNEQTEAKTLLGIYTTSPTDGTFLWQPGVLTQAMMEGRWVLIEDIHRAPPEVIGIVLSIIEHGEILISSRNERTQAASGFCILATTSENVLAKGKALGYSQMALSSRLWTAIEVEPLQSEELEVLLLTMFPLLKSRIPSFLGVQNRLLHLFQQPSSKKFGARSPNLRDLLKWCRRSQSRLRISGSRTGLEPVDDRVLMDIFEDAVCCYAGHIANHELHIAVTKCIAEVLQVSPQKMQHSIYDSLPSLKEDGRRVCVGRASCPVIDGHSKGMVKNANRPPSAFALTRGTLRTMEEIATAVQYAEPALLVGETGIGKTTVIQHLATLVGQRLSVFNLSQQSEGGDLIGGFRPITTRSLAVPMSETFDVLFDDTFSLRKNAQFQTSTRRCIAKGKWTRLISMWQEAVDMASNILGDPESALEHYSEKQPSKRRKLHTAKHDSLRKRWREFRLKLSNLKAQLSRGDKTFAFDFVEGKIVQALRNGEWVLLDEINLASPETLESITDLLYCHDERMPSLLLHESGRMERIECHPNFRIFAAMNPATDAGKRELPSGLRTRFTEVYVRPSDTTVEDLTVLITTYLGTLLSSDGKAADDLARCYLDVQKMNVERRLTDGAGQLPHFSIRSLVRALIYTTRNASVYGLRRSLYEGFLMSFTTMLNLSSESLVAKIVHRRLLGVTKHPRSLLNQIPKAQQVDGSHIFFKHHLVKKGDLTPECQPRYVITPFVERNLLNLARAVSVRRFPILLQGPTSSGKTSMVEYLAKISGNAFIRINNHEHTDLQEYLGFYASGEDGRLQYREGVLVEALRRGHWIVLDELNLAPTDVLEALNRLLDDNRELFIPETQEMVKPHPNFVLFATQNPAGLYGGRKHISRAFRNRFLELHFDDIPEDELEFILKERTQIAPSFCTRIVAVYKKLSMMRQSSRLFEQRSSFATLRDLFRWASRGANDRYQLAVNGFMLLVERVRDAGERTLVKQILEEVMKVQINEEDLYSSRALHLPPGTPSNVMLTPATRRLLVLITAALQNNEPVLLVGETGCGKTQICQTVAEMTGQHLHMLNAHSNTETGDLIGAQRPVRNKAETQQKLRRLLESFLAGRMNGAAAFATLDELINQFERVEVLGSEKTVAQEIKTTIARSRSLFEWADGSLIVAMKRGELFLLDEISLAEDSVLERLNSVLEPERSILLAEKGPDDSIIRASPGFNFLATMNPGGDYGKRELSSALRNRLTEIWAPPLSEEMDILPILQSRLGSEHLLLPRVMIKFAQWFHLEFGSPDRSTVPLRELLAWADLVRTNDEKEPKLAILDGAALAFIDSIGANPAGLTAVHFADIEQAQRACIRELETLLQQDLSSIYFETPMLSTEDDFVQCGGFRIPYGPASKSQVSLFFDAQTTRKNAFRLFRALQLGRPVLLEGDPGVGKTALVEAVAHVARKSLTRINLSDQTDLMDLFGSDVPVEGGAVGNFSWRNGPLLKAMEHGGWVLLDEMNLATQSVLEGLNSCLDHRRQVYIAELDQVFVRHPDFFLFATQNPHHQGGGRKGLPASFVNRFTVVYADALTEADLTVICRKRYREVKDTDLDHVVSTVSQSRQLIQSKPPFQNAGGPWELNLRDIGRWLSLYTQYKGEIAPSHFHGPVISQRFRTHDQRNAVQEIYPENALGELNNSTFSNLSTSVFQLGTAFLERDVESPSPQSHKLGLNPRLLPYAQSLIYCINQRWPAVLVGESGSGKSTLIRALAALRGAQLVEFSVTEDMDTMDLIGGFEQQHRNRAVSKYVISLRQRCLPLLRYHVSAKKPDRNLDCLLEVYRLCNSETPDLNTLQVACASLSALYPEFLGSVQILGQMITDSSKAQEVSFDWNDGVLVEALIEGHWLVLDNANTCKSAVLDRLNSLLEPDGRLIIGEQHEEDGSLRFIQPHHKFRIFLTMDPRRGELSRAMRNRSLEIHIEATRFNSSTISRIGHNEAALFRWRRLQSVSFSQHPPLLRLALATICVDHLSIRDLSSVSLDEYRLLSSQGDTQILYEVEHCKSLPSALFKAVHDFYVDMAQICPFLKGTEDDQPLHPNSNEPLLLLTANSGSALKAERLGWLLESFLDLCRIRKLLADAELHAASHRLTEMTILERSIAVHQTPRLARDETQPLRGLIYALISAVDEALTLAMGSSDVQHWAVNEMNTVLVFLDDLVDLGKSARMRSGVLAIFSQIGEEILSKTSLLYPVTAVAVENSLAIFETQLKLRYGQSLFQLWPQWRPRSCKNVDELNALLKLDAIMHKFDTSRREVSAVQQMVGIQAGLLAARNAIFNSPENVNELLEELLRICSRIESRVLPNEEARSTYFCSDFEALCQYQDLALYDSEGLQIQFKARTTPACAALLAGRDTKCLALQADPNHCVAGLSRIASFAGWSNSLAKVSAWKGAFAHDLLSRLHSCRNEPIKDLANLTAELRWLSTSLAESTALIAQNQIDLLRQELLSLLVKIIECHQDLFKAELRPPTGHPGMLRRVMVGLLDLGAQDIFDEHVSVDHHFRHVWEAYLRPALSLAISRVDPNDRKRLGACLVYFALAFLRLWIPDKPTDPALRLSVQRDRYQRRKAGFETELLALKIFESEVSGQSTSTRIRKIEREMVLIGIEPAEIPVVRLTDSNLLQLQAGFMGILDGIVAKDPEIFLLSGVEQSVQQQAIGHSERLKGFELLGRNIHQSVQRLSESPREYDDLTIPATKILQILDLGAAMLKGGERENEQMELSRSFVHIARDIPFLGATPALLSQNIMGCDRAAVDTVSGMPFLEKATLLAKISCWDLSALTLQSRILSSFEFCYAEWKSHLRSDQSKEIGKAKYYEYRGRDSNEDEVESEELDKIFPAFTDGQRFEKTEEMKTYNAKASAIRMADLQASIFSPVRDECTIRKHLLEVVHSTSSNSVDFHGKDALYNPATALPALFLRLDEEMQYIQTQDNAQEYNIYKDPNLIETRRLLDLVLRIRDRVETIRDSWPEHSLPVDILASCNDIVCHEISSPIAKLLTKSEKLHSVLNEWQMVASTQYSVLSYFGELTGLIVSWRRLELSSWSRLLTEETSRCQDDAKLWWFMVYEVAISIPLKLACENDDYAGYSKDLVSTLIGFLQTASLGQYSCRLQILENFRKMTESLMKNEPAMQIVNSNLSNVITHYKRYEPFVEKSLVDGRTKLEQEVKEQIKLASWKDTNVTTLRESARRSHYKLFKIVRRFRSLLAQPVERFTAPDTNEDRMELSQYVPYGASLQARNLSGALRIVEQGVKGWADTSRRLREPKGAAASMLQLFLSSQTDLNVGSELHEYVLNLSSTIKELRSQTPSKIDDHNRALVLHLKARKRRLLADVLKDVRHMGIRRNLHTQELERQRTLASVLGKVAAITETRRWLDQSKLVDRLQGAEGHFHAFLDLIDQARKFQVEHSEDLSSSEIGRCIGSIEGFLLLTQAQRNSLDGFLADLGCLRRSDTMIYGLHLHGSSNCIKLEASVQSKQEKLRFAASWLPDILELASDVLEIQAKHATKDFTPFVDGLKSHGAQLKAKRLAIEGLLAQELPLSLSTQEISNRFMSLQNLIELLHTTLLRWIVMEPNAAYLFQQLVPWTDWNSFQAPKTVSGTKDSLDFEQFKQRLLATIDKIFVGTQSYSEVAKRIPSRADDASWLLRSDQGLRSAIRSFHMKEIANGIDDTMDSIAKFAGDPFQTAVSLSAIFVPVIQQFYLICEHVVERYADLHAETCRIAHVLVKSFNLIASSGFCGPTAKPDDAEKPPGQVEQGMGLAEGEGDEDISKDVGEDEDLSEIAQQQRTEGEKEQIEKDEHAVDMGRDELQGDMDEQGQLEDDEDADQESGTENADDDAEEEIGSVDSLDPSAVDEKLWEGLADDQSKDLKNETGAGKSTKDKSAAAQEQTEKGAEEPETLDEEREPDNEDQQETSQSQAENADPNLQPEQTLELSDEMQLDGDQEARDASISDDGLDEFSDVDVDSIQESSVEESSGDQKDDPEDMVENEPFNGDCEDGDTHIELQAAEDDLLQDGSIAEDEEQAKQGQHQRRQGDDANFAAERAHEEDGAAGENSENANDDYLGSSGKTPKADLLDANQQEQETTGSDPQEGTRQGISKATSSHPDPTESRPADMFKRLGDVLERWHRQSREILTTSEEGKMQQNDIDMADADYEHLENEEDQGATQALGAATKDEARALDESQAFEDPQSKADQGAAPAEANISEADTPRSDFEQAEQEASTKQAKERSSVISRFVADNGDMGTARAFNGSNAAEEWNDLDHQSSAADRLQAEFQPLTSSTEAVRLWSYYSSLTHSLSLILTEQLRLILSPTQATKLRGDFRSGKRLNIKRIIPYIASHYKRDKIWMRRSVPSKRNYQIMIAVDDSRSMMEGGAHALAFETLALLCKSLSMLEVGDICVVGFGDEEHIRTAHHFGVPFTNESGSRIYQNFSFQQNATNVRKLIEESMVLFRDARSKGSTSSADLWQLQLIISDGICEDHERIGRLVRQASEERIMIVFVIVDSDGVRGNSIMDLTQAVFEPEEVGDGDQSTTGDGGVEMKLRMKRYLDGFPFPYYVVVSEVRDLPGVLATALKGWFREVIDGR